jgi:hypothetical protein
MPIGAVHLQHARMRSAREANVIDIPFSRQKVADDAGFVRTDTAPQFTIARQFQSDSEIHTARRAQRFDRISNDARAALPIAAMLVISSVGPKGNELMEQMSVTGGDFRACEPAFHQMERGTRDLPDQVPDLCRG